ncbi:MAG: hypothetical protein UW81_C0005G0030 [Candidatus Giovannonibacteria bacterium GW2011_GWC2_44_9]|uniref:DUF5667 domain-containing protein n=3 Tax=Candidatus Giovannoniibacteriota TaxID=1752738 RepID=A0A0G1L650_9BACT|nr:MAG: hypothetical protein UW49_C0007G0073 [Candidatus Giovannonibacteria bacterium GW2011_GWB1_44_23]KKT64077.1 MAG: hypothetical protein UW57_C0003G0071 [Candidatus Giovannonibacteria bacterium GW2011_GWA1_44_29]KKT84201.1 MAG: hypothetical protein UW81_C0005G0030 [Candidatus Giovannonibacteria bacterium GW2011_GWC2_44_9]KKT91925.1 MAG: hypothetical protein UW93_C0002G0072 [Parcubacteria group bacterium GW2011_GWC1_45_13]
MKNLCCLMAVLYMFVLAAIPARAQEAGSSYGTMVGPQDFFEFEELASRPMPQITDEETSIPDYRAMYIARAKRFEAFLDKYPGSPLKPEVLLRVALLYLGVERQEIRALRQELFFCQGMALKQHDQRRFDLCKQRFALDIIGAGGPTDPVYEHLARQILDELVERYPHARRYIMSEPSVGGFRFDEEEIGAFALYLLAGGALPEERRGIYELIITEYKIRKEIRREIQNRIGSP